MINKIQRQVLGLNLKVRKTKQPNGDSASKNLRMRLSLRAVSSRFIFLSSAGIKGVHHYHPFLWQTSMATEIKVVTTAPSVRMIRESVILSEFQASFIY